MASQERSDSEPVFRQEAGAFLSTMGEMAPQIQLDYSIDSLQRLDQFISEHFESQQSSAVAETLLLRVGAYLGEVIIRHLGGQWNPEGRPELNNIGPIEALYPIEKAESRFKNGKKDSLVWYYHSIAKQLYEAGCHPDSPGQNANRGGFFGKLKGLFGQ